MGRRDYLLKVQLLYVEPGIHRLFAVPGTVTLDRLHDILQIMMGWQDIHLYEFRIAGRVFAEDQDYVQKTGGCHAGEYRLADVLGDDCSNFEYIYDFDARWEHLISIEDCCYVQANDDLKMDQFFFDLPFRCIDGARACPPEDVGGIDGYYEFCKSVKDQERLDHAECKQWYEALPYCCGEYDCEAFDPVKINNELVKYFRWSRDRNLKWELY